MMKRYLALMLALLMLFALAPAAIAEEGAEIEAPRDAHYIEINEQTFPDENFRLFVREHYGQCDPDDEADFDDRVWYLTRDRVLSVREMEIDASVSDFTGLEHFTELTMLTLHTDTVVTRLNLSANTKLLKLTLQNCDTASIDLSQLAELTYLSIENASLRTLDLSHNKKLTDLLLYSVPIEALNVSENTDLHTLDLTEVPITELDLTNCRLLKSLFLMSCPVAALDVTNCTYLRSVGLMDVPITALDLTKCTKLESLHLDSCPVDELDLLNCEKLIRILYENDNMYDDVMLHTLKLGSKPALTDLMLVSTDLDALDLSACPNLNILEIVGRLSVLDLSACPKITNIYCPNNRLSELILDPASKLYLLWCGGNCLSELDLGRYGTLKDCRPGTQAVTAVGGFAADGGAYTFDMHALVSDPSRVSVSAAALSYDPATGVVTAQEAVDSFTYLYDTGKGSMQVDVSLVPAYTGDAFASFRDGAVQYKGTTAYVVANGFAQKPSVVVTDPSGSEIDPAYYTVRYTNNTTPGTAKATVAFKGTDRMLTLWFKIYLPATNTTAVQNVDNGIRLSWEPVSGARGYVIYRRAWNLASAGWTTFERWNNTTAASWIDTTVYAGTRYQYGVKAYFEDPMDNFNLGLVGPLKTTVRITTRKLNAVTPGSKQLTVKWSGSKVFTGYQIKYATDRSFAKNVTAIKITRPDQYQNVIKNLKSGTTYYVTVRSYQVFEGMTYFGDWSNVLSAKVK